MLVLVACGPKAPPGAPPETPACGSGSCGGASPPASASTSPPAPIGSAGSGLPPVVPERPRATPLDAVSARAAAELLSPLAARHAARAQPVAGARVAGQFLSGQALELSLTLEPGRCYTIVAVGLPAVEDVDIELAPVMPPGLPAPVLAADASASPTAVVGATPNCWKSAAPTQVPARVILSVAAGQGVAALGVYAR